jgi:hypothetical protein
MSGFIPILARSIKLGIGLDVAEARTVFARNLAAKPALSSNHG